MAVEPAVFVPPLVVAHVLGLILLLYSLEKVSGVVSKTLLRRRRALPLDVPDIKCVKRARTPPNSEEGTLAGEEDASMSIHSALEGSPQHTDRDSSLEARAMTDTVKEPFVLTAAWVRGCSCQVWHHPCEMLPRPVSLRQGHATQ